MMRFKLANIELRLPEHVQEYPELLYRAEHPVAYDVNTRALEFKGSIDFTTYFNALSCAKWTRYTSIDKFKLHIELKGEPCTIELLGISGVGNPNPQHRSVKLGNGQYDESFELQSESTGAMDLFAGADEFQSFDIDLDSMGILAGFILASLGKTVIANAYWCVDVPEERIRNVKLAISTTTFKKEDYIIPNIHSIEGEIFQSEDPIASSAHLFVVDNGRTLDVNELSNDHVTVIPNANTGGSGGFARGMMAALEAGDFTHVLLMDDDVKVFPESIKRTFSLLSLVNARYASAFINGAMLEMAHPNLQYEDVSFVAGDGVYHRIKNDLYMDELIDVTTNEMVDVEVNQAYGAWWYSCIPMSVVRKQGLPLPLFVRCDDVEYGMRNLPTYMTMNGICVWHEDFHGKFRAAVDCYQYIRNFLVMTAMHDICSDQLFMARTKRMVHMHLRAMAYENVELILLAFEDYLKGPEYLMALDGEATLKANSARAEKLLPYDEAIEVAVQEHPELSEQLHDFTLDKGRIERRSKAATLLSLARTLPYDRHLLPDSLIRMKPATIFHGGWSKFYPDQFDTGVLIAADNTGESAHVRVIDKERYQQLKKRWKKIQREYASQKKELQQAYKDALPEMTSVEYWKQHLG